DEEGLLPARDHSALLDPVEPGPPFARNPRLPGLSLGLGASASAADAALDSGPHSGRASSHCGGGTRHRGMQCVLRGRESPHGGTTSSVLLRRTGDVFHRASRTFCPKLEQSWTALQVLHAQPTRRHYYHFPCLDAPARLHP